MIMKSHLTFCLKGPIFTMACQAHTNHCYKQWAYSLSGIDKTCQTACGFNLVFLLLDHLPYTAQEHGLRFQ